MTDYRQYGMFDLTWANDAAIKAGAAWEMTLTYEDVNGNPKDLTDYTGYMQIRTSPNGGILADVSVDITPSTGEIRLSLTASETLAMSGYGGVYDLYLKDGTNDPFCLLLGNVEILPNVTAIP